MKLPLSILLLFFTNFNLNAYPCLDCAYTTIGEEYVKSDVVFIAKVNKVISEGKPMASKYFELKFKKVFKGQPYKKLVVGIRSMSPLSKMEKDDVFVFFGYNNDRQKTVVSSICTNSKIIKRKGTKTYHGLKIKDDLKILFKTLKINKQVLGEILSMTGWARRRIVSKNCGEIGLLYNQGGGKVFYVLLTIGQYGHFKEAEFLSPASEEFKSKVTSNLSQCHWEHASAEFQIIEAIYFNEGGVTPIDF